MDEINAVLELFISCRDSSWPLVRLDAEERLLTQHLLLAASMDRDEVATLIGTCFEADHNKEINFLSFWAGMEQLLELLGLRDSSCYVDDKVYGLQVFRDSLLAQAAQKQQGPTNSVLLSRDEVLDVIQRTSRLVGQRNIGSMETTGVPFANPEDGGSAFWDEVYKETAALDKMALLSITELSMMVYEFLKGYMSDNCGDDRREAVRGPPQASGEGTLNDHSKSELNNESAANDADKRLYMDKACSSSACSGIVDERYHVIGQEIPRSGAVGSEQAKHCVPSPAEHVEDQGDVKSQDIVEQHQRVQQKRGPESPCERLFPPSNAPSHDEWADSKLVAAAEAATRVLRTVQKESERPLALLRQLLEASTNLALQGHTERGYKQKLKYLHAAAVDCLDRIGQDSEKHMAEADDTANALARIKSEKQRLQEQLTDVLQHQNQLETQQEQHRQTREELARLRDLVRNQSEELANARSSLQEKTKDIEQHAAENASLKDQMSLMRDELTVRINTALKGEEEARKDLDALCKKFEAEKAALEGKLRLVEDNATAAETARRQQSSEAHSNELVLREKLRGLEQEKHRLQQDAEEADVLLSQLQSRLEEKLQQVAILELKNKQQYRMLQQVRGVRDSLLHLLQEGERKQAVSVDSHSAEADRPELNDAERMRAALKAAQAHIKELEVFVEEVRRGERRALHAHSALFEATSGASQQTPSGTGQTRDGMATKLPLKKVKSLGVEVDAAMILSRDNGRQMGDKDAGQGVDSILESKLAVGDVPKTTESSAKKGKPTSVTGEKKEDSQGASVQVEGHTVEGRLPRLSSMHNPSLASLNSEVSTAVAASRDPPSLLSIAEAEDVFGEFENEERARRCEAQKEMCDDAPEVSGSVARLSFPIHSVEVENKSVDAKVSQLGHSRSRIKQQKLCDTVTSHEPPSPLSSVVESAPDGDKDGNADLGNSKNSVSSDGSFLMLSPCSSGMQTSKHIRDATQALQAADGSDARQIGSRSLRQLLSSLGSCAPVSARSDAYSRAVEQAKTYESLPRTASSTEWNRGLKGSIGASSAVAISASARDFMSLRRGGSSRSQVDDGGAPDVDASKRPAVLDSDGTICDRQGTNLSQECLVVSGSPDRPRRTVSLGISLEAASCKSSLRSGSTKSGDCPERSLRAVHRGQSIKLSPKRDASRSSTNAELGNFESPHSGRESIKCTVSVPNKTRSSGDFKVTNVCNTHSSRCKDSDTKEKRNICSRSSSSDFSPDGLLGGKGRPSAQKFAQQPQKKETVEKNDNRRTSEQQSKLQHLRRCADSTESSVVNVPDESKSTGGHVSEFCKNLQPNPLLPSKSCECRLNNEGGLTGPSQVYKVSNPPPTNHVEDFGVLEKAEETIRSEGTASAAALLAAAAEVVDASLQQQQLMINQQRQHHEDIQKQQQQRIDMLQEQLEVLLRRERLKDRGEQQHQKRLIKSLQAKIHLLQQRQEEKDHGSRAYRVSKERELKSKAGTDKAELFQFSHADDNLKESTKVFQLPLQSDVVQCLPGENIFSSLESIEENGNKVAGVYSKYEDTYSDSDSINSCSTSKILSSQCSTPALNSAVDDTPTTTSSPFISATPTASLYSALTHTQEESNGFSKDTDACGGVGNDQIAFCMTHHAQTHPLDTLFRHSPRSQGRVSGKGASSSCGPDSGNSRAVSGYRRTSSSSTMLWSAKEAPQTLGMGKIHRNKIGTQGVQSSYPEESAAGLAPYAALGSSPHSEQAHEFRSFMRSGHSHAAASVNSNRCSSSAESHRALIKGLSMLREGMHPVSRAERASTTPRSIDSASFLGECARRDVTYTEKGTRLKAESSFNCDLMKAPAPLPSSRSIASSAVSYATAPAMHVGNTANNSTRKDEIRDGRIHSSEFLGLEVAARCAKSGYISSHAISGRSHERGGRNQANTSIKEKSDTNSSRHRDRHKPKVPPSTASTGFSGRTSGGQGFKRTVQTLVNAKPTSVTASTGERGKVGGSTGGSVGGVSSVSSCRQTLLGKRFENSEAAAAYYRSVTKRKQSLDFDKASEGTPGKKYDESTVEGIQKEAKESKSKESEGAFAALQQLNSDWKDFNENLINQMQKWIG